MIKKIVAYRLSIVILLLYLANCTQHTKVWNALWSNPEMLKSSFENDTEFLADAYFYELGELFEQVRTENDKWYLFEGSQKIAPTAVIHKMMEDLEGKPSALTSQHENFNRFFAVFDKNI